MKQLKLLGLGIVVMLSLSLAATSVAAAAELSALPEKMKFSFKSKAGESTRLQTLAGKKIECKSVEGGGEFTSARLGTSEFKFKECKEPTLGLVCTGLEDTNGIITAKGEFHIRHLLPASEGVNIAVLVTSAHFSCSIALFVVSGCVASMDLLTKEGGESIVNKLVENVFVNFLQENGDEKPIAIDEDSGLAMENCVLLTKEGSNTAETSGQLGSGTIEKFSGANKTILIDLSGTF